jgi:hypothetical protein
MQLNLQSSPQRGRGERMNRFVKLSLLVCGMGTTLINPMRGQSKGGDWLMIGPGELCVTEGAINRTQDDRMSVDVAKMRAYVTTATMQEVELRFRYAGATASQSALASGQMRRQFGLKLHAQDPCNLVYVMWRIEPESKLVVSVKRNPSDHTSAECGNRGYTNIKPRKTSALPLLRAGESHGLRAELAGQEARVFVDNREVWEGDIGAEAAMLHGPVGIRSDNTRLDFELKVRGAESTQHFSCNKSDSD